MNKLSARCVALLAGLIQSDGYWTKKRSLQVGFTSSDMEYISLVLRMVGSGYVIRTGAAGKHTYRNDIWTVRWYGDRAREILRLITPYSTKAQKYQALVA